MTAGHYQRLAAARQTAAQLAQQGAPQQPAAQQPAAQQPPTLPTGSHTLEPSAEPSGPPRTFPRDNSYNIPDDPSSDES